MTNTGYPHIVRDDGGVLRVEPHWFKVRLLIGEHVYGDDAEQIAAAHPPLTLAQAHMILAYYYDHKAEIDAELAERERQADELRAEIEERQGPHPARDRLRTLKAEWDRLRA